MTGTLSDIRFLDLLPESISKDPAIEAAASALDAELQLVNTQLKNVLIYERLDDLEGDVLNLLAWQFSVDFFDVSLPDEQKRECIRGSIAWHKKKGTAWAVRTALANAGYEAQVVTFRQFSRLLAAQNPPKMDGSWLVDGFTTLVVPEQMVGVAWMSHWAQFCVRMDLGDLTRVGWNQEVRRIIDVAKNARSWPVFYYYLNMETQVLPAAWIAGASTIKNTCIPVLPCPVRLDGTWRLARGPEIITLDGSWQLDGFFRIGQELSPEVIEKKISDCRIRMVGGGASVASIRAGFPEEPRPDFTLSLVEKVDPPKLDGTWQLGVGTRLNTTLTLSGARRLDGSWKLQGGRKLGGAWRLDGNWMLNESWTAPYRQKGVYKLDGTRLVGFRDPESAGWPQARGSWYGAAECLIKDFSTQTRGDGGGWSYAVVPVGKPGQVTAQPYKQLAYKRISDGAVMDGSWIMDGTQNLEIGITIGGSRRLDGTWKLDLTRSALVPREGDNKLDGTWKLGRVLPEERVWPVVKGGEVWQ